MFHNEELLQVSNRASGKTLETLLNITDQGKQQQQTLTDLFGNGQADSAMLKALSMVATICLPASLVAVSMSDDQIRDPLLTMRGSERLPIRLDSDCRFSLDGGSPVLDLHCNHATVDASHYHLDYLDRPHIA